MRMAIFTLVNGKTVRGMAKALSLGRAVALISVRGKKTRCMVKALKLGRAVALISVNG